MKNKKSTKFYIVNNYINNILFSINFNNDLFYCNFLNLIREHDIFFKKYSSLFINNKFKNSILIVVKILRFLFITIINLLFSYQKNNFKLAENSNAIIISHLLDINDLQKDRYFGDLEKYLEKYKINSTRLLFNYQTSNFKNKPSNVVLINKHGGLILELKIIYKQIKLFYKYLKNMHIIKKKKKKILLNFYKLFLLEILSNECRNNIRFSEIIQKLLQHNNIKFIFCTLEGHNWEKIAFSYSKNHNAKIKTVGYTASLIFNNQKIINKDKFFSIPDVVLTNCINNKNLVTKYTKINNVVNIGSLNTQYNFNDKNHFTNIKKSKINCLIIPENIESEFFIFIELIQNYIKKFTNIKFNIKIHPGMLNNKNINKYINKNKIKNCIFTKDDTISQVLNSDCVLFRGSNAILLALKLDKTIIYYNKTNEFNINPLHQEMDKIHSINSIDELNKISMNLLKSNYDFKFNYIENLKKDELKKLLN